ncbi:MAG: hypothetical protein IIZ96_02120 [Oscillospiraceae bacterium]|nr:hypothetical protein [Oscillospiraceae bacterium]
MAKKTNRRPDPPLLPLVDYAKDAINMAADLIAIPNLPKDTPKNFIVTTMIRDGGIGYWERPEDDPARGFYRARKILRPDRLGIWHTFDFFKGYEGGWFRVLRSEGARYVRANAEGSPTYPFLMRSAIMLDIADRSIAANIRAQIYGRVIKVPDNMTDDDVEAMIAALESGKPFPLSSTAFDMLRGEDISVPFTADRVAAVRSMIWGEMMKRVGSVAADHYKRERTQSAEVSASVAEAIDMVYIMINTFNDDCERQEIIGTDGKPLRMIYSGYLDRFDQEPGEDPAPERDPGAPEEGGTDE